MEKVDIMLEPIREFLLRIAGFLPQLAVALGVLIAGLLLAKLARFALIKGLRAVNFNVLTERAGLEEFMKQGGIETDTTGIFGLLIYWVVILAALIIAFNSLGLTYITELLGHVVLFVPKVVVAILILAFGSYFARFVGKAVISFCKNIAIQDSDILGKLAQYAVMTFVVLIALDQINVGGDIVRQSFLIILAGVVFALALAFGLGGKDAAAELIDRWWPRRGKNDGDLK
ncbi:MAG: mechanosensitive ion channel family protein [Desulfuromonadaceae bacterium]